MQVLKALGDPTRLDMLSRMASRDEYPCTTLEHELPVGKSTISYHVKILSQAGLVSVSKKGRFYFYTLHRDIIEFYTPGLLGRLTSEAQVTEP
ncbi:ArsR/SmtB family transcription factor [Saccharopolyspora erythraea]|uniref:ArsR/SmtB family transcription factor n=1 Tax=Saccharopolyspora erythraea TaxID=1836 RepID=UPI001BAAB43C|nr:metalloregulator ArsR/SmtB family transcription factor [Saccharopolyspora erythraea]